MKNLKLFVFLSLAFNSLAQAQELKLHCKVDLNSSSFENDVILQDTKAVTLGNIENYEIIVKLLEGTKIELQAYDSNQPARNYASATLTESAPEVQLSVWRRESLLEATCTLAQ